MAGPNEQRNALVLSGGGIKFSTHIGLLMEMATWRCEDTSCAKCDDANEKGWLNHFDVVVGTSAGSVAGALHMAGYSRQALLRCAPLLADPRLSRGLFDVNWAGASAAVLTHDVKHALGGIRGYSIQTLLETLLTETAPKAINELVKNDATDVAILRKIAQMWDEQRVRATRQRKLGHKYYKELLNFGHRPGFYAIGVNTYTGQKTVFGHRPLAHDPAAEKRFEATQDAYPGLYFNPPSREELDRAAEKAPQYEDLVFHRYANRLYTAFAQDIYGDQLPIALAVRVSLSIPIIFEPVRIRRRRKSDKALTEDVLFDGGVADGFSVSVARDPVLGNCDHVLAIFLGSLGYRLPDHDVTSNPVSVLVNAFDYGSDALVDEQYGDRAISRGNDPKQLRGRVTILNALTSSAAKVTETERVGELLKEGTKIAKEFWGGVHGSGPQVEEYAPYPTGHPVVAWNRMFPEPRKIFLSQPARATELKIPPVAEELELGLHRVIWSDWLSAVKRREWQVFYAALGTIALALAGFGVMGANAIAAWKEGGFDATRDVLLDDLKYFLLALLLVILVARVIAFALWRLQVADLIDRPTSSADT